MSTFGVFSGGIGSLPDDTPVYIDGWGATTLGVCRAEQTPKDYSEATREATLRLWERIATENLCGGDTQLVKRASRESPCTSAPARVLSKSSGGMTKDGIAALFLMCWVTQSLTVI